MPDRQYSIALALSQFGINLPALQSIKMEDICNDSRVIKAGDIFAATQGTKLSGDTFIEAAIEQGAALIIKQCKKPEKHGNIVYVQGVPVVKFYQLNQHLADLAALYYQLPANNMTVIGFTGTNGKTSSCQLTAQLFDLIAADNALPNSAAVIGTNGAGKLDNLEKLNNTTPGPTQLQKLFSDFRELNVAQVSMEVSSHALEQKRIQPELIDVAVFTNLTRDHLDYHGTMENYANAKKALFCADGSQAWVFNIDDAQGRNWYQNLVGDNTKLAYGLEESVTRCAEYVTAKEISYQGNGMTFILECRLADVTSQYQVTTQLLGRFNLYNLLSAVSAVLASGESFDAIAHVISKLKPVPGRMEVFPAPNGAVIVVDYAHTPDGLENALAACKQHCQGKLHVVFGCGGDRDAGKRPLMAQAAEKEADSIIISNDNPRSEAPEAIAEQILAGLENKNAAQIVLDRSSAISQAIAKASEGDIVLCAGKGHEDYMIIGEQIIDYNERAIVSRLTGQPLPTEGEA